MLSRKNSESLFEKAQELLPGGVNSPVRAFKSVEGAPLFIKEGKGCRIWDEDENEFIDFCCSWGPLILGHSEKSVLDATVTALKKGASFGAPTRYGNELADLIISNHGFIEKIRFVSSGTEAVMSAIRLARGATKKNKLIKFEGCYHGHVDSLLVKAGSGLATFGVSSSAGVPETLSAETIVLPLNDEDALSAAIQKHKHEIAAVIIEPIPANNGLLVQRKDYLSFLRDICTKNDILLIFDEVISGFRIGFEGAAGYYGIAPDLITFGKIIGGGMPVGAYAGSTELMRHIAPEGEVYQAGTLSANPVAMAAGKAQLNACLKPNFYAALNAKTKGFVDAINQVAKDQEMPFEMTHMGSIFWMKFKTDQTIRRPDQIDSSSMNDFKALYSQLLDHGLYFGPSGYEVGFISAAHTEKDLEQAIQKFSEALHKVYALS